MTKERTEDWIYIKKPNGEERIANPSFIRALLGIKELEEKLNNIWSRLLSVERRIDNLETPLRKEKILKLLNEEKKPRTSYWITNRVGNYRDIAELEEEGKFVIKVLPKSHRKLYAIKQMQKVISR